VDLAQIGNYPTVQEDCNTFGSIPFFKGKNKPVRTLQFLIFSNVLGTPAHSCSSMKDINLGSRLRSDAQATSFIKQRLGHAKHQQFQ
jgi:hypothetical protein